MERHKQNEILLSFTEIYDKMVRDTNDKVRKYGLNSDWKWLKLTLNDLDDLQGMK